jgi:hypothetical protein
MKTWLGLLGLVALFAAAFFAFGGCGASSSSGSAASDDDDNDDASPAADDDSSPWQPVEAHRETVGAFTVVWLAGTPYEMGRQQGVLMHDELAQGVDWLKSMHILALLPLVSWLGITGMAENNSYADVVQECQGLVDAAGDVGWTQDLCLLLNFGDVLVEFLQTGIPPAEAPPPLAPQCSQAVGTGAATTDGKLYHMRSLDWGNIDYLFKYPVVFVRQPSDGIPHAIVGFPGDIAPYNGINAEGVSIASDQVFPHDQSYHSRKGHSNVQMLGQILKRAHNLEEARAIIAADAHMACVIFTIADGAAREASVFEITSKVIGERGLDDNVVYATNHFMAAATHDADQQPQDPSSLLRFARMGQLIPKNGADSLYGKIDPAALVGVLRDRVNPYNGTLSPAGDFDNGGMSISTNAAVYQMVFDGEDLNFWVAAGYPQPVPRHPFQGFSLSQLLDLPKATPVVPPVIP